MRAQAIADDLCTRHAPDLQVAVELADTLDGAGTATPPATIRLHALAALVITDEELAQVVGHELAHLIAWEPGGFHHAAFVAALARICEAEGWEAPDAPDARFWPFPPDPWRAAHA